MNVRSKNLLLLSIVFLGMMLWFLPNVTVLETNAWHFLIIFTITIISIIINPYPMGVIVIVSILISILTETLSLKESLEAFNSSVSWLAVFAFFISRGFIKTGLGKRCSYYFVSKLGNNPLGLCYSLVLTEVLLAPLMPSATARGGGIIFPIAKSLSEEYKKNSVKNNIGKFLIQTCFQSNVVTSAMFLTAIATNPLTSSLARDIGIDITWGLWAIGAIVPGIVNLIILPLILYFIYCPLMDKPHDISAIAKRTLKELGMISKQEIIMIMLFVLLISFWVCGKLLGIDATTTALLGFSILLLTKLLTWDDVLKEKGAWDCLIWFSILVMMSKKLVQFGIIQWLTNKIQVYLVSDYTELSIILLCLFYFYIHYIFASVTAHVSVLYATFATLLIQMGVPAKITVMFLAYLSILSGGLSHFSIGSAPIFYESKYFSIGEWWKVGAIISVINIIVWTVIGNMWWYYLGWW